MWGRITSSDIVLEPAFRVATGDLPGGDERHFAFVVPLDDATERDLAGLRVRSGVRSASRLPSPGSASSDPEPQLSRVNAQQVQVGWNAARAGDFQLIFSDGVKSITRPGRIFQ